MVEWAAYTAWNGKLVGVNGKIGYDRRIPGLHPGLNNVALTGLWWVTQIQERAFELLYRLRIPVPIHDPSLMTHDILLPIPIPDS